MKCCGSPTISTAVNDAEPTRVATRVMQAVLFGEILKPLTTALGPVGDVVTGAVAERLVVPPRP